MVYLLLPSKLVIVVDDDDAISAVSFFGKIVDCLANRGLVIWFISQIQVFTGVSSLLPNTFFFIGLVMWNPFTKVPRLQDCTGVFTFYAAREIVQIMQKKMGEMICCSFLVCLMVCMLTKGDSNNILIIRMAIIGTGIVCSTWLEKWVKNWSQTSDWMVIYLLIFMVLEGIGRPLKDMIKTTADDEDVVDLAHDNHSNMTFGAIAHEQALLGLPQTDNAAGVH